MRNMIFIKYYYVFILCILFLSVWCNGEDDIVSAPMVKREQEALYSAIQGFVGKWWNGSDLYPDPCGWTPIQGVSCDLFDGLWYVTDLSLGPVHDNSLICAQDAQFSPHLFALRHLKFVSFSSCFVSPNDHPISIQTPNWEFLAQSLIALEFRSNSGLIGQRPYTFGNLKNLESLVLTENELSGEMPTSIGNLIKLKRLNLSGNRIKGAIPNNLDTLNKILILDLSRNSLSGQLPLTFGALTSILKLDLSHNQLEGNIPREIGNLKNLALLDISNNIISGEIKQSLQELTSLQELILSNNPIGGTLMNLEWDNLVDLRALDLSNMILTGGVPKSIGESNLRFLSLHHNKLTGDIPVNIGNLPNVAALYIHGNKFTGKLRFSRGFYERMGRRFGAWDNPNLCYPMGLITYVPFGVKKCLQEEVTKYGDVWILNTSCVMELGIKNTVQRFLSDFRYVV